MHTPTSASDPNRPDEIGDGIVRRSRGSTPSERLLADLGDHAFLKLWSYPNLFYDKKQNGKGDGKELCDMLVVCGDDVIIFSDKRIKFQEDQPIEVAWPRFYRNAIEGAVTQINGANNWIYPIPGADISRPRLHAEAAHRSAARGDQAGARCRRGDRCPQIDREDTR
jgi:hypothetical protein